MYRTRSHTECYAPGSHRTQAGVRGLPADLPPKSRVQARATLPTSEPSGVGWSESRNAFAAWRAPPATPLTHWDSHGLFTKCSFRVAGCRSRSCSGRPCGCCSCHQDCAGASGRDQAGVTSSARGFRQAVASGIDRAPGAGSAIPRGSRLARCGTGPLRAPAGPPVPR
jgi:hypothetical protein